jgi:c(7)-type cytochrome triheme protein
MAQKGKFKNSVKLACMCAAMLLFAVSCLKQATPEQKPTLTGTNTFQPPPVTEVSDSNYDKFNHEVIEHAAQACATCHYRAAGTNKLTYPGHSSCISCHVGQFTNPASSMCTICHSNVKSVPVGMKSFPVTFKEGWNVRFDHGDHDSGAGRPPAGCASCHDLAGARRTIPAGISAHSDCYTCHTPESKIGSCNTCHALEPYSRTVASRATFVIFRHGDHAGAASCNECHDVRPGAGQGRQVASPVAVEHKQAGGISCRTCHNDSRAFGEANFANCKRCHTGAGFDMLPGQ